MRTLSFPARAASATQLRTLLARPTSVEQASFDSRESGVRPNLSIANCPCTGSPGLLLFFLQAQLTKYAGRGPRRQTLSESVWRRPQSDAWSSRSVRFRVAKCEMSGFASRNAKCPVSRREMRNAKCPKRHNPARFASRDHPARKSCRRTTAVRPWTGGRGRRSPVLCSSDCKRPGLSPSPIFGSRSLLDLKGAIAPLVYAPPPPPPPPPLILGRFTGDRVSAIATGGRVAGRRRYRSASAIARSLRQASATKSPRA
eukprot:COSAG06_NODE_544_length_14458_cov_18.391671_6_plen_257_part_00